MTGNKSESRGYINILKSSSIVGGAQGINYLISMVKAKFVAILLGPSGVGLVGLYMSAIDLVGTFTSLGINISGVREVASAHASGDTGRLARTITTLRRACLVTGISGLLLTPVCAYPLSVSIFGSPEHALPIGILGLVLALNAISAGQNALLQGTRRIRELAIVNVSSAFISTFVSIILYAWFGKSGIILVLIATSAITLCISWGISRRIRFTRIVQTWAQTLDESRRMVKLGLAFMYGALLASIASLVIRSIIVKNMDLDSNGIYQAAWGISGMFAGFIINAMSADFYPRLTAAAHDNEEVNGIVNEQIDIGILLALPGLAGTLAFAPFIMQIFYSAKFIPGAELLPWFVVGVFTQVIIFPIGMVMRAKGAVHWIYAGQTEANAIHIVLSFFLIPRYGVIGTGYAFLIHSIIHGIFVNLIARHLSGFRWCQQQFRLCLTAFIFILLSCCITLVFDKSVSAVCGLVLFIVVSIFSLRAIMIRIGPSHRITSFVSNNRLLRIVCGL